MVQDHFWGEHIFNPKQPIFKAFCDFRRAKIGHHGLKTHLNHLFWHSKWSTMIFQKRHFLRPMDLIDQFWHPPPWATSCSLPQPTGPRYGDLGVGYGNFEGWKPPKVGGCGWIRCARNRFSFFEPRSPRYGLFLVWGCRRPMCTNSRAFGGLLGAVRGHTVELD